MGRIIIPEETKKCKNTFIIGKPDEGKRPVCVQQLIMKEKNKRVTVKRGTNDKIF